jgi:signal peptidase II
LPETNSASKASARSPKVWVLVVLAIVAVCIYALDQFTKYLIVQNLTYGDTVNVLGDILQFRYVKNPGAAFSLGTGMTWLFSIVAAGVAVFIIVYARRIRSIWWAILFGLLLGGTLGNLSDRLLRPPRFGEGHVVDFIEIWGFPAIFNIADSAIVVSMCMFVILTIAGVHLDGTRGHRVDRAKVSESADAESADAAQTHAEPTHAEPTE